MKFIEDELGRFSKAIKDTYVPHWPADMTAQIVKEIEPKVKALGPAGATAQIGVIGPTAIPSGPTGPTGPVGPHGGTFSYSTDPKPT
jgi:hypothetical protein